MSGEVEWRAELVYGSDEVWCVVGDDGWEIASGLNEPTARLIAASWEMQGAPDLGMEAARAFETPSKPTMFGELFADFQHAALESLAKSRVKP